MIVFVVLGKCQLTHLLSFCVDIHFLFSPLFILCLHNKHKISFCNLLAASSRKIDLLTQLAKYVSAWPKRLCVFKCPEENSLFLSKLIEYSNSSESIT